jgi:hypothetical protein
MRLMKYSEGWTRRHSLEQVGKAVFAAGVLSQLMDMVSRHGTVDAALPAGVAIDRGLHQGQKAAQRALFLLSGGPAPGWMGRITC